MRGGPRGSDSQGAGGQKGNGKKANDQEGYDLATAESGDGQQPVNPFLWDFFDAMDEKDYNRMLEYLAKMAGQITPKGLDEIYMVFGLSPEKGAGERESRFRLLRNHIRTLKKVDGVRLR